MNDDRRSLDRTPTPNPAVRSQWKWKDVPYKSRRFRRRLRSYLQATGLFLLRYGLAAMTLLFGLQKWTKAEAEGILPWVSHSPLNVLALSCDLGSGCVRSHRRSRTGDCRESRCS